MDDKQDVAGTDDNEAQTAVGGNFVLDTADALALQLLDEAIVQIPFHEKNAYVEALRLCPHLIEEESDPLLFLQYEHYNTWAAARRLVKYWEWRAILFNRQAYKPILDLKTFDDGDDKNTEFLEIVKDGGAVLLSGKDFVGNSLVFFDKRRFRLPWELMDSYRLLRIVFFMSTRVMQSMKQKQRESNDLSTSGRGLRGLRVLELVDIQTHPRRLPAVQKSLESFARETFPYELKSAFLIFVPNTDRPGWARYTDNVLPFVASILFKSLHITNIFPIFKFDKQDIPKTLEPYGITDKRILPEAIGGTWSYDNYDQWFHDQLFDGSNNSFINNPGNLPNQSEIQLQTNNMMKSIQKRCLEEMGSESSGQSIEHGIGHSEHGSSSNNERRQPSASRSSKKRRRFPFTLPNLASSEETQAAIENLQRSHSVDRPLMSSQQWSVVDYWRQKLHPSKP